MVRRTYGQLKSRLAQVAQATGMPITDSRLLEYTNDAVQELIDTGDYPGVVDRWLFVFDQTTGILPLPYEFDRLMQVSVDDIPIQIVSPWFEFYGFGPGPQYDPDTFVDTDGRYWVNDVLDRGDSPTNIEIPAVDGPWNLRVYNTVSEDADSYVNIQGLDPDGLIIRTMANGTGGESGWINGENLYVPSSGYTQSMEQFSKITAFKKLETNGYIRLTAWNGTTEVELGNYAFNETDCSRRRYYIPTLFRADADARDRIVMARCRRRFVPVAENNDTLLIGNILALQEMMIAQWKRKAGSLDEYAAHKSQAIAILRAEANSYLGKSRIPAISFQRGYSFGSRMMYLK